MMNPRVLGALVGMGALCLAACAGPSSTSNDPATCPEEAPPDAVYADYTGVGPVPNERLRVVSVDSEVENEADGAASYAVDGNLESSWRSDPFDAFPHAVEVSLGETSLVRGVRLHGVEELPAIGEYSLYVAARRGCWGDPVATGSLTSAEAEIPIDGKVGKFVRLVAHSAQGGGASVSISELDVLVGAGIVSRPPGYALVGEPYAYQVVADLPDDDPAQVRFELVSFPVGAEIDAATGKLHWVPASDQEGDYGFQVRVSASGAVVEQRFEVHVATPHELVTKEIDAESGGTIEVDGTGTSLDGMVIEIPPGALPNDETIRVALLSGTMPELWAEQTLVGDWFTLLPRFEEPVPMRITLPVAQSALPDWASTDDVKLIGFTSEIQRAGGEGDEVVLLDPAGTTLPGSIASDFRMLQGQYLASAATRFKRYDRTSFVLYWALESGGSPSDRTANAILDDLETARSRMLGYGCQPPERTPVVVASFRRGSTAAAFHLQGVLYVPTVPSYSNRDRLEILAHEYFHATQNRYTSGRVRAYWFTEATAVFMQDMIVDEGNAWHDWYGRWGTDVTLAPIDYREPPQLMYQRAAFFLHLAAAGNFNACAFYRDHAAQLAVGDGIGALRAELGDFPKWWNSFATGYDYVRSDDWIHEASRLDFSFDIDRFELDDCKCSQRLFDQTVGGAISAVVEVPEGAARLTFRVESDSGYRVGVYGDDDFHLLNTLESSPKEVVIDNPPAGDVVVTYSVDPPTDWRRATMTAELGDSASVVGQVREEDGSAVAYALVKATPSDASCSPRYASADEHGQFEIEGVPVDSESITVEAWCRHGDAPGATTIHSPEPGQIDAGLLEITGSCSFCKAYFGDSATVCPVSGRCADMSLFCNGIPAGCSIGCTNANGNTTTEDEVYCFDGRPCAGLSPVPGQYCDRWPATGSGGGTGYCPANM